MDWAEIALMDGELDESQTEPLAAVLARLGAADVRVFGLTWEDCEDTLHQLGYAARVEGVMKLPNAEQAIVEIAKLRDYSLDATHEEGKHKARVFAAALGIGADDAGWLREKLLDAPLRHECERGRNTPFGQRIRPGFSPRQRRARGPDAERLERPAR